MDVYIYEVFVWKEEPSGNPPVLPDDHLMC